MYSPQIKKHCLSAILLIIALTSFGQTEVKFRYDNGKGSFSAYPPPSEPKGILILIPDYLQTEEELLAKTQILHLAYVQGIVTVIVPCGRKLFADQEVIKMLREVSTKSIEAFELPEDKVAIGGYGYGGTIALKYAQFCLKYEDDFPLTPAAIYAVESHVDIMQAFKSYEREIAKNVNTPRTEKLKNYRDVMVRNIGGSPSEDPFMYKAYSPFDIQSNSVNEIEMLLKTPIRLYNDLDVVWSMKNKLISAYDMAGTTASEMIYQLNSLGNKKAELIKTNLDNATKDKNENIRTSVDEKDLLQWILNSLTID